MWECGGPKLYHYLYIPDWQLPDTYHRFIGISFKVVTPLLGKLHSFFGTHSCVDTFKSDTSFLSTLGKSLLCSVLLDEYNALTSLEN